MNELKLIMGKDGVFREYKEPYCVIECPQEDYDHIVKMVERGEKMRWIPVTERLPDEEDDREYLIVVNGKYTNGEYANGPYATQHFERAVEIAIYSEEEGWILEAYPDSQDLIVTHWMPLPEPPEVDLEKE